MSTQSIWDKFTFTAVKQKNAGDYLKELKEGLLSNTHGNLDMEIEVTQGYVDTEPPKFTIIYKLFVVAPKMGNFRRKILSVAEYPETGKFPVEVVNHYNNNDTKENVTEGNFKTTIEDILSSPIVKSSIEYLYQMSADLP